MTKNQLREYTSLNIELKRLGEKIETLEAKISAPRSQVLSDMPKGGSGVDMGDEVAKLMDLKQLYKEKWDRLIIEQKKIEQAIDALPDPTQRTLMGYKYIDGLTWEEVCDRINYSWRQVYRLHNRALSNMA